MSNIQAFLYEEGVLLDKSDKEFDAYSKAYDHKYGYYDIYQSYCLKEHKEKAIKSAYDYVKSGSDGAYAVISHTVIPEDFDVEEGSVENESYLLEDVVYSVAKINGKVVEHFMGEEQKEHSATKSHKQVERD